jgi:predicted TIM-barrel fold metal-dependent hydrolase
MTPRRIVDTHHHLWDLSANYYPWLSDRIVAKPYGDYAAIRWNYLVPDFTADIGDLPVVKSVHLNAGHDPSDPVRETRWLQAIAGSNGPPHAIVADVDLAAPEATRMLEAHCAFSLMRGVRAMLSDSVRYPEKHPDLLDNAAWQANVALLPRYGLSLDVQLYPQQMRGLADLARKNPALQILVCHTGLPEDQSPAGRKDWGDALRLLAAAPNVALKISGFGICDPQWTHARIKPLVAEAIDAFGADRCMFGSNFPVDRLFSSYARVWDSYIAATEGFSEAEIDALFYGNAVRLYRL